MDLGKVLADLKKELANLDAAIGSLERLEAINRKRTDARGNGDALSDLGETTEEPRGSSSAASRARKNGRRT